MILTSIPEDFLLIAGPCVIEDQDVMARIVSELACIRDELGCEVILKASYDKANRTSAASYRGPGMLEGLKRLKEAAQPHDFAIISDVHETEQVELAAEYLDIIQIPSLLSRQTSLIQAAAATGKIVNIKKGQFLSGADMAHVADKAAKAVPSNCDPYTKIMLTERGNMFGYNNIVADMRNLVDLKATGFTTIFDASHTAQMPGAGTDGAVSGGRREITPTLAQAAVASGADGLFIETHPKPENALSDSATVYPLEQLFSLVEKCLKIHAIARD